MALQLTSSVLENGGDFPIEFTCNGDNVNPPLSISGVPQAAACLVLLFDDPDAAKEPAGKGTTFDHWIIYNLPAKDQTIDKASPPKDAQFGINGKGTSQYLGPCPPSFKHEYVFRVYAVDAKLTFDSQPTKTDIENAIREHVIDEAKLIAYYEQPTQ